LATASASNRKRWDVDLGGQLPGEDHLEGDQSVQADLARPGDDAHGAAGDFADQLVVAEVADRVDGAVRRAG